MKQIWGDLKRFEGLLVTLLNIWAIIADFLTGIGTPVKVVISIAAGLALVALILQNAITAQSVGGLPAFLTAIIGMWSIISANLSTIGVPIKVITAAGAGLAIISIVIQNTSATKAQLKEAARIRPG